VTPLCLSQTQERPLRPTWHLAVLEDEFRCVGSPHAQLVQLLPSTETLHTLGEDKGYIYSNICIHYIYLVGCGNISIIYAPCYVRQSTEPNKTRRKTVLKALCPKVGRKD